MKDIFVPLLLVLALAGGAAWWSLHGGSIRGAPPANSAAVPEPAVAPKPAPVHSRSKHKTNEQLEASAKPVPIRPPEPAVTPVPEAVPVRTVPPFPTTEQVKSGAQEENIVERFGDPALSITTSDHDHVFETLVYTRDEGQRQTLIHVEDGKVTAAYAQTMPPPMNMPASVSTGRVRH